MPCSNCTAPTTGLALCNRCLKTFTVAITNLAAYYGDVSRIRPGQRVRVSSAYRSTPPPSTRDPRDPISEALQETDRIVTTWTRVLVDDRGLVVTTTDTQRRCAWLEQHKSTLAALDTAGRALADVLHAERRLKAILDRTDTGWYAGICSAPLTADEADGYCTRQLYGTIGTSWINCPSCGAAHDTRDRREVMMREARDQVAPVQVIARAVVGLLDTEVSVERLSNRIDQWVRRKRLRSLGTRVLAGGRPQHVYRIGDVFDLLEGGPVAPSKVAAGQ